ncbi:MAG: hypothetical protein ABI977_31190 [Acidobacteriota bacterium]
MLEFVVVGEAAADVRLACALADRVASEEGPDWLREQELAWLRIWTGVQPNTPHSTWGEIRRLSRNYPELTHLRRFAGTDHKLEHLPDYAPARKAILLSALLRKDKLPAAIVLIRDLDHQPSRLEGMLSAREDEQNRVAVIIAAPNPKREAWVLNGFVCENERERAELESVRQEIKFDPCLEAERLRYASQTSRPERDPKKILQRLTAGIGEREEKCWAETSLTILRERGVETYLNAYLEEIRERLLPLFSN